MSTQAALIDNGPKSQIVFVTSVKGFFALDGLSVFQIGDALDEKNRCAPGLKRVVGLGRFHNGPVYFNIRWAIITQTSGGENEIRKATGSRH